MDEVLKVLLDIIGIKVNNEKEILNIEIEQENLKNIDMIMIYATMKNFIKKKQYKSDYLNCLHDNSLKKQRFPAVNMLRQIMRCNGYHLYPYVVCNGFEGKGGKKIRIRYYRVRKLETE